MPKLLLLYVFEEINHLDAILLVAFASLDSQRAAAKVGVSRFQPSTISIRIVNRQLLLLFYVFVLSLCVLNARAISVQYLAQENLIQTHQEQRIRHTAGASIFTCMNRHWRHMSTPCPLGRVSLSCHWCSATMFDFSIYWVIDDAKSVDVVVRNEWAGVEPLWSKLNMTYLSNVYHMDSNSQLGSNVL